MKNSYSKELIEYAKQQSKILTKEQLRLDLQDKFNIIIDKRKFTFFTYNHNIRCIDWNPLRRYTKKILNYARDNAQNMTIDELLLDLKTKFGFETTRHNLQIRLYEYNIYCKDNNKKSIGEEIKVDRERIMIKTDKNNYEYKHRLMYEKYHNVKLTNDDYIIFLDGNRTNYDKNNLYRLTRREINIMNGGRLYSTDRDLTKLGILSTKLMIKAKEKLYEQNNNNWKFSGETTITFY